MTPFLVILCAPSGAGKTTIAQRLVRTRKDVGFSISATTRAPRRGEQEGKAYYFISREKFEQLKRQDAFLECAQYAGEWYGTLKSEVARLEELGNGHLPTLVIDATGSVKSMSNAFNYIGHTGRMVYVGIVPGDIDLPDPIFHSREQTLHASRNAVPADFTRIINLIETGQIDTTPWITHRTNFDSLIGDFPSFTRPETGVIKAMVEVPA